MRTSTDNQAWGALRSSIEMARLQALQVCYVVGLLLYLPEHMRASGLRLVASRLDIPAWPTKHAPTLTEVVEWHCSVSSYLMPWQAVSLCYSMIQLMRDPSNHARATKVWLGNMNVDLVADRSPRDINVSRVLMGAARILGLNYPPVPPEFDCYLCSSTSAKQSGMRLRDVHSALRSMYRQQFSFDFACHYAGNALWMLLRAPADERACMAAWHAGATVPVTAPQPHRRLEREQVQIDWLLLEQQATLLRQGSVTPHEAWDALAHPYTLAQARVQIEAYCSKQEHWQGLP